MRVSSNLVLVPYVYFILSLWTAFASQKTWGATWSRLKSRTGNSVNLLCTQVSTSGFQDGHVGLVVFPVIVVELVILTAIFAEIGGTIYTTSGLVLTNLKRKQINGIYDKGRKCLWMRVQRSMPQLKVRFGQNFLEMATCLNVLDFCVNRTVGLLLMSEWKQACMYASNTIFACVVLL